MNIPALNQIQFYLLFEQLKPISFSVSGFALYVKHGKSGVNAGQGEQTVIKLAHNLDSKHPVNIALEKMKDRLDELSGGKY